MYTSLAFFKFINFKLLIMKKNVALILFVILFCSFNLCSQEQLPSYFKNNKENKTNTYLSNTINNNSLVFINQIEQEANNLNVTSLNQIGLYNIVDISQSQQTNQVVNQIGNKNYYSFVDFYNSSAINFSVLQQGNSNSLQIYGSNSLMNGMKIVQKSNFKNIVIKNYN